MDWLLLAGGNLDMGGKGGASQANDTGRVNGGGNFFRGPGLVGLLGPWAAVQLVPELLAGKLLAIGFDDNGRHMAAVCQGRHGLFLDKARNRRMQGRGNQGLTFGDHFAEYNLLARFYQRGGRPADMLLQRQDHLLRRGDNLYRRIRREVFLLGRVHTMGEGSRTGEQPQNAVVLMVFFEQIQHFRSS